jgi:hypothetical protein
MIWTYALLQPVIVDVLSFRGVPRRSQSLRLLQVCHESRAWTWHNLFSQDAFTDIRLINWDSSQNLYMMLPPCGKNILLVSHAVTLPKFTWLCNSQKGVFQPVVGVVAIDTFIFTTLIRERGDTRRPTDYFDFNEEWLTFLPLLCHSLKVFSNLQEVIVLSRPSNTYQDVAADLAWFLGKPVAGGEGGKLYRQRMRYYTSGPPMKKIPKITSLRYTVLSGEKKPPRR